MGTAAAGQAETGADRRTAVVVGASGFIGSAVVARLKRDGLRVIALVRDTDSAARRLFADGLRALDLGDARRCEDWLPFVAGADIVINCAGVLQSGQRDSTRIVHEEAPTALFEACERAKVRRLIHFSAMGADGTPLSDFSRSKGRAEATLSASRLDWVILRPSVVVGRSAYGGSALFRGLASLPFLPRLPDTGRISVVQLDDVAETVARLASPDAAAHVALDLVGPEQMTFEGIVARYRRWFGWPPARPIVLPPALMNLAYRLGDLAGWLGWRPPIRSNARLEAARGAAGDPAAWKEATGIVPRSLDAALQAEPASVQERWFARLFLLKPLVIGVFAFFWLLTGAVSIGPGYDIGVALMREGGAGALSGPSVIAGGLADLAIGAGILWRRTSKTALWAALAITLFYVVAGTALLPRLWEEPLGPMMKVWPILVLNLVALAILDER